jgi:hypothetical protein
VGRELEPFVADARLAQNSGCEKVLDNENAKLHSLETLVINLMDLA